MSLPARHGGLGAVLALLCLLASAGARADSDAGWFEAGDLGLRTDLLLLNDAGVIAIPVSHWPLPRAAVSHALARAKTHFAINGAVIEALDRVRGRVAPAGQGLRFEMQATAGEAGVLRGFDSVGRENGELMAGARYSGERLSVTARVAGAASPEDDQSLRLDRSHATVRVGNWLLSANTLERFWGPAYDSSLILSNNARPMPTLMVERAVPAEFESRWLQWLGPWRFSLGISRMEDEREDIDAPLFMAWRVTVMPWRRVELGFSRTAQFCGRQLPCDLDSVADMLLGRDNPGFDATPESEPGNQMAGFDIRWHSPIGTLPYAVYGQMIGEDESGYLPAKYLEQFGLETWMPRADGAVIHAFAEYIDTTCGSNTRQNPFDCAYNQGRFNIEGYRYRGRVVGHTADRDTSGVTVGATYTRSDASLWSLTARSMRINRDQGFDPTHSVAQLTTDYLSLQLGWRGRLFGGRLSAEAGAESLETAGAERDVQPFGFLSWTYEFQDPASR